MVLTQRRREQRAAEQSPSLAVTVIFLMTVLAGVWHRVVFILRRLRTGW